MTVVSPSAHDQLGVTSRAPSGLARWVRGRPGTGIDSAGKLVLVLGTAAALYLLAAPLGMLLFSAFRGPADFLPFEAGAQWSLDNFRAVYQDAVLYTQIIPDTLVFSIASVALTFILAFTLAWLVERTNLPGRNVWYTLILFPFLMPTVVLVIAWIFLLGPQAGWLNVLLRSVLGIDGQGPLNIFSMHGLIVCQALASTPFAFILLTAALKAMNPALEEASGASGASPWTTFYRVTLPVLLPALLAPVIIVLLITLEQFEIPLILGLPARVNVFSYRIWYELNPSSGLPNYGGAAAVALPFLAIAMVLLVVYNWLIRRAESYVTVTGKAYRQKRFALGIWRVPAVALCCLYVAIATVLPALVLLWTSFFGFAPPSPQSLERFSTAAYSQLFSSSTFWLAVRNTMLVATSSALLVTALGVVLAWIIVRTRFGGRHVIDFLSFASIGIPSVIAGLGVMLVYLSVPIGLYGTVWILIIAYSYRFAVTTRISRAALMQLHNELEEASAASGARWLTTQFRIVLPLLRPSLTAAFILLFIVGVREFTISLVLHSQENVVLSVLLWRFFVDGHGAMSAAVGSLIIVLVVPVILFARKYVAPRTLAD